jgi:hypothetical protein
MSALAELTSQEEDVKQLVDEFACLHLQLADMQKTYDDMKKRLSELANSQPSKTQLTLRGYEFSVGFSESPLKSSVPETMTNAEVLELYGIGAFSPSVTNIKAIEALRTREQGFSPSILQSTWGSRRLLKAFRHKV